MTIQLSVMYKYHKTKSKVKWFLQLKTEQDRDAQDELSWAVHHVWGWTGRYLTKLLRDTMPRMLLYGKKQTVRKYF